MDGESKTSSCKSVQFLLSFWEALCKQNESREFADSVIASSFSITSSRLVKGKNTNHYRMEVIMKAVPLHKGKGSIPKVAVGGFPKSVTNTEPRVPFHIRLVYHASEDCHQIQLMFLFIFRDPGVIREVRYVFPCVINFSLRRIMFCFVLIHATL